MSSPLRTQIRTILIACAASASSASFAQQASDSSLQEIVVTATRREAKVSDLPFSISAYAGEDLDRSGATSLADLGKVAPGIAVADPGTGNRSNKNNIVLRGLNAGNGDVGLRPTDSVAAVSTYIGETPIFFPMHLSDVDRIEVLRGPQGTLYGSGALAGTIRVIPHQPNLKDFSAELSAGLSSTENAPTLNKTGSAMVNLPLVSDRFALRISGGWDDMAGFIDNKGRVVLDNRGIPVPRVPGDLASGFTLAPTVRGINTSEITYGRASLLWRVTDTFDAQFTYSRQKNQAGAPDSLNPDFPGGSFDSSVPDYPGSPFPNTFGVPGGKYPNGATAYPPGGKYDVYWYIPVPSDQAVELEAATLTWRTPYGEVTSTTSYYDNRAAANSDTSPDFNITVTPNSTNLASLYGYYPRLITHEYLKFEEHALTEEARFASSLSGPLNYVVGAYYQNLTNHYDDTEMMPGVNEFFGISSSLGDETFRQIRTFKFQDKALFGEATWQLTPAWDITGGLRAFTQDFSIDYTQQLPFCGALCANDGVDPLGTTTLPRQSKSFSDQIFKLGTSYRATPAAMVYATFAQGFRRGGANAVPIAGPYASLPAFSSYKPDKVDNFEVGVKGNASGVTYSVALFREDWKHFQIDAMAPSTFLYVLNASKARSQGLEFEISSHFTPSVGYRLGYTYTSAKVVEAFRSSDLPFGALEQTPPAAPIVTVDLRDGDPLPMVPKNTLAGALTYDQMVGSGVWTFRSSVNASYRSGVDTDFNPLNQNGTRFATLGGFTVVSLNAGLDSTHWEANLYVNNLANTLGESGGHVAVGFSGYLGRNIFVQRPRTIGLQLRYRL